MHDSELKRLHTRARWEPHRIASWSIRVLVFAGPVVLGFIASLVISRSLPPPAGIASVIVWWACLLTGVLLVVLLATAAFRRFLPLAALLNLSLVFPDQAPSRFAIARQTGSARQLAAEVAALRESARDDPLGADQRRRNEGILALVAALSVHDSRTRGHSERVRVYTDMLSEQLGLPEEDRDRLRWASMLHDIGKLTVPSAVLNKSEPLDEGDWDTLHRHPLEGARILSPIAPWLGEWALAAEHHHEWWDGTGYPRGLRGEEISLAGRIVAVADAYETMTASRPYRRALTPTAARGELVVSSGRQFDPRVVRAFLEISVGRLWRAVGVEALVAQLPLIGWIAWFTGRLAGWGGSAAATAGAVTVLAVSGVLVPALPKASATAAATARAAGAPDAPATVDTAISTPVAPAAAAAAAPAVSTSVLGTSTAQPSAPSSGPAATPGSTPPPAVSPVTGHGASAFTPGHGYDAAPGRGGQAPGRLLK